jgi:quercetin dioxygenase-like cupin family protein
VHYEPGLRVERHVQLANEIIYLVAGQLTVGDRTCEPGTAITVEAGTVYGPLVAGPEGAEFFLIMDQDPNRHPKRKT